MHVILSLGKDEGKHMFSGRLFGRMPQGLGVVRCMRSAWFDKITKKEAGPLVNPSPTSY